MPKPNEHSAIRSVDTKQAADFIVKLFNVVPIALLAEAAKAIEILADLGSGDRHALSQL